MQVNIKATQKELEEKSDKLVLAVASILDNSDSELSDKLVKAIQDKQAEFNDPVLQELLKIFAHNYNEQTQKMIQDIEKVLKGESVWKSLDDGVSYFHLNDGGEYIEDFEDVEYLTKGGPVYIGPRGGKWADPAHTIPYQEEVHGVEIPKERYSDEEAKEIMFKMGESLFRMQVSNPLEKDDTGFNSADTAWWGRGVFGISNLRRILKKYKRQLINNFGDDYYKCGIHEQSKNPYLTIKPKYTNNGDLIFPTDGSRLANRKAFDDYVAIQKKYELRFNGDHWKLAEPKVDDFDFDSYKKDLEELGHIVDDIIGEKKSKEVKEKEKKELDVTETLRRIKNRQIDNAVVLKKVSPTTFAFIASYSPEFNDLFSNKKGLISGVFKVNKERNWARETSDINLVEEAIEKIKRHLPKHLLVIDEEALKEAQIARDQYAAELEKPIPEVQRKLAPEVRLYPYQNEAVRFLDTTNGNALIGDEMGLGKTLESLAWVAKEDKKTIIVCPKVVRRTWLQEGHKFFPNQFKTAELIAKDLRSGNVPDLKDKNLVSVNYESLHKFYPLLKEAGFDTIIIDESHRMKNPKAKTTKSLQKITELMKHKILLSGTAIKNKKEELFTQINVVAPGMFTHKDQVKFATIGGLWEQMKKFYIARAKATVLKDLPEKSTSIILNEMEGLPDYTGNVQIGDIAGIKAGVAIGKAPYTANFVKELLESSDSRILVFSDSVEAAKKIKEELGDIAILHHGQMADEKREQIKEEFQRKSSEGDYNSQYRVLVTTRQSMAVGATLTAADKVVFNDLPWNAADLRQAEDRCHRVGQKNNVNVYWMTADNNTFDSSVVALINRKYELSKKVNQGKKLTDDEIKWMEKPVNIEDIMKRIQGADVNLLKEKEEIAPIDEPDKRAPIAQEEQEEKEKEIKDQQRKENGLLPVDKNADNITILNNIRENSEKVKEAEIVLRGLTENTGYGTGEGVIDNFNTFYFKDKIAKFKDDYEKNTEEYIKQFSDTVKQYASSYKEILSTNDKLGEKLKKLLDQAKEYDNTFSINKLTPIALIDVYNAVKDLNIKQLTEKERTPLSVEEARRGALKGYIQLLNEYINVEKAKLEQVSAIKVRTRIPDSQLTENELVERIKSYGRSKQSSYGLYVKARDLKPVLDAKDFYELWDHVGINPHEKIRDVKFKATHKTKVSSENIYQVPATIMVTEAGPGFYKFIMRYANGNISEGGSPASTFDKYFEDINAKEEPKEEVKVVEKPQEKSKSDVEQVTSIKDKMAKKDKVNELGSADNPLPAFPKNTELVLKPNTFSSWDGKLAIVDGPDYYDRKDRHILKNIYGESKFDPKTFSHPYYIRYAIDPKTKVPISSEERKGEIGRVLSVPDKDRNTSYNKLIVQIGGIGPSYQPITPKIDISFADKIKVWVKQPFDKLTEEEKSLVLEYLKKEKGYVEVNKNQYDSLPVRTWRKIINLSYKEIIHMNDVDITNVVEDLLARGGIKKEGIEKAWGLIPGIYLRDKGGTLKTIIHREVSVTEPKEEAKEEIEVVEKPQEKEKPIIVRKPITEEIKEPALTISKKDSTSSTQEKSESDAELETLKNKWNSLQGSKAGISKLEKIFNQNVVNSVNNEIKDRPDIVQLKREYDKNNIHAEEEKAVYESGIKYFEKYNEAIDSYIEAYRNFESFYNSYKKTGQKYEAEINKNPDIKLNIFKYDSKYKELNSKLNNQGSVLKNAKARYEYAQYITGKMKEYLDKGYAPVSIENLSNFARDIYSGSIEIEDGIIKIKSSELPSYASISKNDLSKLNAYLSEELGLTHSSIVENGNFIIGEEDKKKLSNIPAIKAPLKEEPIKNEVKEIEDDIKDTQNRIDKLRDRQFKDYQSGNITRAKITTYNADISNYNDRLQELKQDLKNLLTKEEVLKEKPIIVRKPITEEIKEPALTIPKDEPVKRGRGRPPKPKPEIELPKKPRGRPPKIVREPLIAKPEIAPEPVRVPIVRQPILSIPKEEPVKRGRGRPRKEKLEIEAPKRPRGRPRKEPVMSEEPKRPRGRPRKFEISRLPAKLSPVQLVENQLSLVSAKNIELNKIGEDATHFIYKPNSPLDDDDARLTMNQIRGRGVNVIIIPGENSLVKIRRD